MKCKQWSLCPCISSLLSSSNLHPSSHETPFPCWRLPFGWTIAAASSRALPSILASGHSSSMPRFRLSPGLLVPTTDRGPQPSCSPGLVPSSLLGLCPCSPRRSLATLDDWLFIAMLSSVTCPSWPLLYSQTGVVFTFFIPPAPSLRPSPLQSGSHSFSLRHWLPRPTTCLGLCMDHKCVCVCVHIYVCILTPWQAMSSEGAW